MEKASPLLKFPMYHQQILPHRNQQKCSILSVQSLIHIHFPQGSYPLPKCRSNVASICNKFCKKKHLSPSRIFSENSSIFVGDTKDRRYIWIVRYVNQSAKSLIQSRTLIGQLTPAPQNKLILTPKVPIYPFYRAGNFS